MTHTNKPDGHSVNTYIVELNTQTNSQAAATSASATRQQSKAKSKTTTKADNIELALFVSKVKVKASCWLACKIDSYTCDCHFQTILVTYTLTLNMQTHIHKEQAGGKAGNEEYINKLLLLLLTEMQEAIFSSLRFQFWQDADNCRKLLARRLATGT